MNNHEKEFEEISDTLVTAYQNWEIWWLYKNKRPKYVQIMNYYLQFFSNSLYAHWVTTIMSIWCLIDDKNLSLINFYKKVCSENVLSTSGKKEIDARLNDIAYIIKGIKIIRHNVVAHISNNIDSEDAFKIANLTHNDIRDVIVELGNIFNRIRVAYGKNQLGFYMNSSKGDTEKLLTDLKQNNSKKCLSSSSSRPHLS